MTTHTLRLSLGPILYYWERETLFDFYEQIAKSPIDIVYLGETVCSKRRLMRDEDWLEIAAQLERAGKEVVLSTLTLIEANSELSKLKNICKNEQYTVEANDMAAVNLLSGKQTFVTGPAINIYNARTLSLLAKQGVKRWVFPVELSRDTLADILEQRPEGVETEVFAYGRLPLAFSARCFTARYHNLQKDDCQLRCIDDPDGLLMSTREDDPFLVINGIQTQSAKSCNLVADLEDMKQLGVDVLRISPQSKSTIEIINIFHDCLHGKKLIQDASEELESLSPTSTCNGYWHGGAGMESVNQYFNEKKAETL
ncbi:MAG: U32 family peptidase [Gammaproteobacteria bacterium]